MDASSPHNANGFVPHTPISSHAGPAASSPSLGLLGTGTRALGASMANRSRK